MFSTVPISSEIFQSTLPLRGATAAVLEQLGPKPISIHAPLTGSDDVRYFTQRARDISIHAPLTGSDLQGSFGILAVMDFNPRSPYGERLYYI